MQNWIAKQQKGQPFFLYYVPAIPHVSLHVPAWSLDRYKGLRKKALDFGVTKAQSDELAIEAGRAQRWISRKFVRFLVAHCDPRTWDKDDLFRAMPELEPSFEDFEQALREVYRRRSPNTNRIRKMILKGMIVPQKWIFPSFSSSIRPNIFGNQ